MKRWSSRIVKLLVLVLALTVPAFAFVPGNLTIPDSAEAISYGTSGGSRNLLAYRFGTGNNVMVLGFASMDLRTTGVMTPVRWFIRRTSSWWSWTQISSSSTTMAGPCICCPA